MFWSSRATSSPRRLLIVAAAALIPALAGCEAGNNAPTIDWHQPTDGAGTFVGDISIRNVFVLGAPLQQSLPAGQSASLYFALVNTGPADRLLSIQAPGTATSVSLPHGSIRLGTSQAVLLTGPRPKAVLNGLTRTLTGGSVITLVLNFQKAGTVRLHVPVLAMAGSFATFSPAPPTPSPAPTARKHHRSGSPSASTSPSAPATPTPSASSTP